jgi:hypothetical protein
VQRQIAAFERTWYRANTELRRARQQSEAATDQAMDRYLDSLHSPSPSELASLHQTVHHYNSIPEPAPKSSRDWPPTDEKTGKPLYFVG